MSGEETKWIETVAGLLALYGVFALVPVSVYLMYINLKAFQAATPETRRHCATVHWVFVVSTVLLMVAAGLFHYKQSRVQPVLWGSVMGLVDQEDLPMRPGGSVRLKQTLDAVGLDDQFFHTSPTSSQSDRRMGAYRLRWALEADPGISALILRIQQVLTRPSSAGTLADPLAGPRSTPGAEATIVDEKDFRLDLDSLPKLRKQLIRLAYAAPRGAPAESIGVLQVLTAQGPLALPVIPRTPAPRADPVSPSTRPAESGSPAGDAITMGLHSSDIGAQATARESLIASGPASCAFIASALKDAQGQKEDDKGILIHNLAKALENIERQAPGACRKDYLPFALAYYDLKDFASAVTFFDKVPETDIPTAGQMYSRGYAYYHVGARDSAAISSLTAYLAKSPAPLGEVKAHLLLGRLRHRSGATTEAIKQFRAALKIQAAPDWARAVAANDVAYLYTQEFTTNKDSLRAALSFVDSALTLTKNPNDPAFLDTKGWILYRLGECTEAERVLEKAISAAPANATIQGHLKELRSGGRYGCVEG